MTLVAVGMSALLCAAQAKEAPLCPTFDQRRIALTSTVDTLLDQYDSTATPGGVVAIVKNGKIVYQRAYGMADLERRVAVMPHTIFDIASISKQFTTAALALLEERGQVAVDDDIRKYFPELPAYSHAITVRHLIHHTSGLRDFRNLWDLAKSEQQVLSRELALALIARQTRLNFRPGDAYGYSNSNYFLLALLVERVAGVPLPEFAEREIFSPLGMQHTRFDATPGQIVPNRALGYKPFSKRAYIQAQSLDTLVGDGGILTTIGDLAIWDRNFYDNKIGHGGPELIMLLQTRGRLNDGETIQYAWGLDVDEYHGHPRVRHSGHTHGFTGEMQRFPELQLTVMALSNLASTDTQGLVEKIIDLCLDPPDSADRGAIPAPIAPAPAAPADTPAAAELAQYAGRFYSADLDATAVVEVSGTQAMVAIGAGTPMVLTWIKHDQFERVGRPTTQLHFTRGEDHHIDGFTIDQRRVQGLTFTLQQKDL